MTPVASLAVPVTVSVIPSVEETGGGKVMAANGGTLSGGVAADPPDPPDPIIDAIPTMEISSVKRSCQVREMVRDLVII
jgi:hypothetical protein